MVRGSEGVRVASEGAAVELSGTGETEYVGFVWRSSSSFEEFTNEVPEMADVEELLIRQQRGIGWRSARGVGRRDVGVVVSEIDVVIIIVHHHRRSAAAVQQERGSLCGRRRWGRASYSMDGLHVSFTRRTVVGVRLSSAPAGSGSFEGWSEVVFHFGRVSSSGSVSVSASSALEAVSGESVSVSSESVSVSAGKSLEVSGGESVSLVSETVSVSAAETLEARATRASLAVSEDVDVLSGGAVTVSSASARLESSGAVSVASGSEVSVSGASASLEVSEVLEVSSGSWWCVRRSACRHTRASRCLCRRRMCR